MKTIPSCLLLILAASCGPSSSGTGTDGTGPADPAPPVSELRRRHDAACESFGPRATECAIADAKATLTPEQLAELDLEKTAPENTRQAIDACRDQTLSSRQVRVYEVCLREETACEPLFACLENADPQK